jgi:hypothetical protein
MLAPLALPAAAVALGTAAITGPALYRTRKEYSGIGEGSAEGVNMTYRLADKQLRSGRSAEEINRGIDAQINNLNSQINTSSKGFMGWLTGADNQDAALQQQVEALNQLKEAILQKAAEKESQKESEKFLENLTKAMTSGGASAPIHIEISVKDADKLPEILQSKLIKPLEQQIKGLQNRVYNMERQAGIEPQPSSVG